MVAAGDKPQMVGSKATGGRSKFEARSAPSGRAQPLLRVGKMNDLVEGETDGR